MGTLDRVKALVNHVNGSVAADKRVMDFFYSALSVLDQKASGLLSANALMIAAAGIFHSEFHSHTFSWHNLADVMIPIPFWIALLLLAVSSSLCIRIFSIEWPQLSKVACTAGKYNFAPELYSLERVFDRRTCRYMWTSRFTQSALWLLVLWLILVVLFTS